MGFAVAVVFYSRHGRLVTLANVVAEGARSVRGRRELGFEGSVPPGGMYAAGPWVHSGVVVRGGRGRPARGGGGGRAGNGQPSPPPPFAPRTPPSFSRLGTGPG